MPLFDHFHPPLYPHHHWESFHSNWATRIADGIAAVLPPEFQVEEHTHAGPGFEIDVATYEGESSPRDRAAASARMATRLAPAYAPPVPDGTLPAAFPDTFEVREREEIDLWQRRLTVGEPLPALPLRLTGELFVAVDFEAAYQEACRRRRLG